MLYPVQILRENSGGYVVPEWSSGSDEEIAEALNRHYLGLIDITEYWSVGDEREVLTLSGAMEPDIAEWQHLQKATLVLLNVGGKELNHPIGERTECAFIVGQKYALEAKCAMNTTDTNAGGWASSGLRNWCNTKYPQLLPETIRNIFKEHKNVSNDGADAVTSVDLFSLPSTREVMGENGRYDIVTNKQFEYYKDSLNANIKYCNPWRNRPEDDWYDKSSIGHYRLRTANNHTSEQGTTMFMDVNTFGSTPQSYADSGASIMDYIVPFGCI